MRCQRPLHTLCVIEYQGCPTRKVHVSTGLIAKCDTGATYTSEAHTAHKLRHITCTGLQRLHTGCSTTSSCAAAAPRRWQFCFAGLWSRWPCRWAGAGWAHWFLYSLHYGACLCWTKSFPYAGLWGGGRGMLRVHRALNLLVWLLLTGTGRKVMLQREGDLRPERLLTRTGRQSRGRGPCHSRSCLRESATKRSRCRQPGCMCLQRLLRCRCWYCRRWCWSHDTG